MRPTFESIKTKASNDNNAVTSLYMVMKEFGYTLEELMKMPFPTFVLILEEMRKEAKEMERANKIPIGRR